MLKNDKIRYHSVSEGSSETPVDELAGGANIWYNRKINPLRKYTVRGTIWYQGEGHYNRYSELLKSMIEAWRREFENPEMYFGVVQLPRYTQELTWFLCREEQKKVASMIDNVTYSVNIDTGLYPDLAAEGDQLNADGIHPYDKEPVGRRLANAIMEKFYGAEGVWRGPVLESAKLVDGKVRLKFTNVGEGLVLTGEFDNKKCSICMGIP